MNRDRSITLQNRRSYIPKSYYKNEMSDDNLFQEKNLSDNYLDIPIQEERDFWYNIFNRNNNIKHVGFNYKGRMLKRSLSGMFWLETKRESILKKFEDIVFNMVENVKEIKKSMNYIFSNKYTKFN